MISISWTKIRSCAPTQKLLHNILEGLELLPKKSNYCTPFTFTIYIYIYITVRADQDKLDPPRPKDYRDLVELMPEEYKVTPDGAQFLQFEGYTTCFLISCITYNYNNNLFFQ